MASDGVYAAATLVQRAPKRKKPTTTAAPTATPAAPGRPEPYAAATPVRTAAPMTSQAAIRTEPIPREGRAGSAAVVMVAAVLSVRRRASRCSGLRRGLVKIGTRSLSAQPTVLAAPVGSPRHAST